MFLGIELNSAQYLEHEEEIYAACPFREYTDSWGYYKITTRQNRVREEEVEVRRINTSIKDEGEGLRVIDKIRFGIGVEILSAEFLEGGVPYARNPMDPREEYWDIVPKRTAERDLPTSYLSALFNMYLAKGGAK